MKKLFLLITFLLSGLFVSSQRITNYKVLVTGDSHTVDTPPGGSDSLWVNKFKKFLEQYFDTVTLVNLGIGGTTTTSLMPDWYGGTNTLCNIDRVLSYNPDLIVLSSSGNTTVVLRQPADTSIKHFRYLVDTLRSLNKAFILTGQDARQKTFVAPITAQTYHDTSTRINNWMKSYCPKQYVNVYDKDYDKVIGLRPWPYVLKSDSLHKSDRGQNEYYLAHIQCAAIDSLLSIFRPLVTNIKWTKTSTIFKLSCYARYKTLKIYGGSSYSSFTLLNTYTSSDEYSSLPVSITLSHSNKTYIKLEFIGRRDTKTITLR